MFFFFISKNGVTKYDYNPNPPPPPFPPLPPPFFPPDINEFISQSGWFSYPGLAHGKQALLHVLAKKMRLSYEVFMAVKNAIYKLVYHQGEKVCRVTPGLWE